jgi:hypothetical protein
MDILIAIVAILIGLAVCFFGYRLFRILLPLAGLVVGYAFGAGLVQPDQWLLAILMGVVVAIVFAVLAWMFWSLSVIIGGALLGFGLGWQIGILLFVPGVIPLIIAVVVAIAAAVLFAKLRKVGIMILTAANGASAAIYGLGLLLPFLGLNSRPNIIATLVIIVLGVVGFFVQYSMHKAQDLYVDIGY